MSGILPDNGVVAGATVNTVQNPLLDADCAALFFKMSCNPKFDPAWANAVTSELLNFMKCAGHPYDCEKLTNMCEADRLLFDKYICETGPLSSSCGATRKLAMVNNGTCWELAWYTDASLDIATEGFASISSLPPNQDYVIPDAFVNPTLFYNYADYQTDGGTNPANRLGLNEAKILNSRVARMAFVNPCTRVMAFDAAIQPLQETFAQDAYEKRTDLAWRVRTNGGAWAYPYLPGTGRLSIGLLHNALSRYYSFTDNLIVIPAGNVEVEWFYIAEQTTYVRWIANTNLDAYGPPKPSFRLRVTA